MRAWALWAVGAMLAAAGSVAFAKDAFWPGVVLYLAGAVVGVATLLLEATAEKASKAIQARIASAEAKVGAINLEALAQLQKDVEYLKTREALHSVGLGM